MAVSKTKSEVKANLTCLESISPEGKEKTSSQTFSRFNVAATKEQIIGFTNLVEGVLAKPVLEKNIQTDFIILEEEV